MVVRPSKMSRKNQGKTAWWAFGGEATNFAVTSRTWISPARRFRMTGAKRGRGLNGTRRKAHHQEGAHGLFLRICGWWSRYIHHQFSKMLLIERHAISGIVTAIGFWAKVTTDSDLCGKTDNPNPDPFIDKCGYCLVYIARVWGQQRPKDN